MQCWHLHSSAVNSADGPTNNHRYCTTDLQLQFVRKAYNNDLMNTPFFNARNSGVS